MLAIVSLGLYALLVYLPFNIMSVQQRPEQRAQPVYDYYVVTEEKTGVVLMYVPLVLSIGDDVIGEDNCRYRVVRITGNQAYARFLEKLGLHDVAPHP
ncbi:hypothetical protein [Acetonema longum]|uniref:Uncharacterized protein n=1 Tax=Acetonema longum DSM 6540 TaxID=1009370 RepID=F7NM76_9FIRM|nr:hypothetical protein [Acetonema longum]EGO62877.1 hypothetical protein ALO_16017 [Acetonema longum DSM 6540]